MHIYPEPSFQKQRWPNTFKSILHAMESATGQIEDHRNIVPDKYVLDMETNTFGGPAQVAKQMMTAATNNTPVPLVTVI